MVLMERQYLKDGNPKLPHSPLFGVLNERLACVECGIKPWHAINWDSKRTPYDHISKQEDLGLSTRAILRFIEISPSVWLRCFISTPTIDTQKCHRWHDTGDSC